MGSKDKAGKLFMACHDVFAELINVLVFEGANVVEEEYVILQKHSLKGNKNKKRLMG